MYKFCNKCGNITLGNKHLEEKCSICGKVKIPVPINYIQENEILTDKELDDKKNIIIEELVKTSPEFDEYLFNHRDSDLHQQWTKTEAALKHGKAVLEGRNKSNQFGVECPYCHATDVKKITNTSKAVHTALFGIFSISRNSKNFHCNNCGADF